MYGIRITQLLTFKYNDGRKPVNKTEVLFLCSGGSHVQPHEESVGELPLGDREERGETEQERERY